MKIILTLSLFLITLPAFAAKYDIKEGQSVALLNYLKADDEFVIHKVATRYPLGVRVIGIKQEFLVDMKTFNQGPYKYFALSKKYDVIITDGYNKYYLRQ